ncbi:MAG: bifunctional DNA-formamidopyrimidine glycosylase/DNA-(apurinic or apyrimidinic site) lyase [Candidatus Saccharimonadales bacterium]
MPELPEVETVRLGLNRLLPDLVIKTVNCSNPKSFSSPSEDIQTFLIGAKVRVVKRRAKVLLVELSSNYSLVIHLKMTGQLVFQGKNVHFGAGHPTASLTNQLPDKSTRVIFEFGDGSRLFFNDQRKFGWIRLIPTAEVPNIDFIKKFGPEPLEADFSWQILQKQLQHRPKTNIKAALLDQAVIAGVGNIYADESLWGARIHPKTITSHLPETKIKELHAALVAVLRLSLKKGGSTDRNYVDAEGKKGNYLSFAKVFRLNGQPCQRCSTTILKIRLAGRGTHFCPRCQRLR